MTEVMRTKRCVENRGERGKLMGLCFVEFMDEVDQVRNIWERPVTRAAWHMHRVSTYARAFLKRPLPLLNYNLSSSQYLQGRPLVLQHFCDTHGMMSCSHSIFQISPGCL